MHQSQPFCALLGISPPAASAAAGFHSAAVAARFAWWPWRGSTPVNRIHSTAAVSAIMQRGALAAGCSARANALLEIPTHLREISSQIADAESIRGPESSGDPESSGGAESAGGGAESVHWCLGEGAEVSRRTSSPVPSRRELHPPQALFDLEATNTELKADLRDLYITSAKEADVTGGRKAIIIHVCRPPPLVSSRTPPLPILHQKHNAWI